MAPRRVVVSGAVTTGFTAGCEHCGKGYKVVVVPKEGQTFMVPRRVLNWFGRMAEQLDEMGVKMVQLEPVRKAPTEAKVEPAEAADLPRSDPFE